MTKETHAPTSKPTVVVEVEAIPADFSGTVFTCPMHPEIRRTEPGDCPKCNMHLVPEGHAEGGCHDHDGHNSHPDHNADAAVSGEYDNCLLYTSDAADE